MIPKELVSAAQVRLDQLAQQYPDSRAVASVREQLDFLTQLNEGKPVDKSLLPRINVGVLAAREIEDLDPIAADLLYKIQAAVRSAVG